jgi:hypothetical protein
LVSAPPLLKRSHQRSLAKLSPFSFHHRMTRLSFLCMGAAILALFGLSSCANTGGVSTAPNWPNAAFSSVRAYVYDCDADDSVSFFQKGGRVTKGVINTGGSLLNAEQVNRLQRILQQPTPRKARTACFIPHHAFVYYDAAGKPVGHVEICFTCDIHRAYPGGLPTHVDMDALWNLLGELDVARGEGRKYYQDLYKQTCALRR